MRSTALHGRFPIRLLAEPAIPLYTNLDSETFPIGTIKELYRLRWGIKAILLTEVSKMASRNDAFVKPCFELLRKKPPTLSFLRVGGFVSLTY